MKKITIHWLRHLPAHEKRLTLSTIFTLLRVVLTPFIVGAMYFHFWGISCALFIIAALTDIIDGKLARWRNERTFLGAALDPVADKFLLLSCFFTLTFVQSPLFAVPLWFVLIVLCKEVIVIGGACLIYMIFGDLEIRPTWLGKTTTVIQMAFIIWLFACYFFAWVPVKTYYAMLGIMLLVTVCSCIQYVMIGYESIRMQ